MKKSPVIILLLVLVLFLAGIYALAKTPPLSIKDPSPAKLTPSYAVLAVHAKDAGKKWKTLLRGTGFRDFAVSPGGQALQKNYILPLVDSFFPKQSAKHISGHFLKLLSGDVLISKFEGGDGGEWVFVAKMNTRQKIGFRFMRMYLKRRNKLNSAVFENVPFYEITLSPQQKLYHAVTGNYVIFATQKILLEQSLTLAAGKGNDSLHARADVCQNGFDSCFTQTAAKPSSPLFTLMLLASAEQETQCHEVIHILDSAEDGKLRTTIKFFGASQGALKQRMPDMKKISLLLPKDTVFFASLDFSAPLRRGESLQAFLEKKETRDFAKDVLNLNVMKELLPYLEGSAVLASSKIKTLSDETPVPDFMLLLPLKPGGNTEATRKAALSVTDKIFSRGMKENYVKKENSVYGTRVVTYVHKTRRESAVLSPSYAALADFLAVTLTKQDMEKILAVKKGYLPCLQDAENFARFKMPEKSSLYFNADGEKSAEYLKDYLTQVIPVSSGFLVDELNSAFLPFVKEFNRFSAIEGALYQGTAGSSAEGSVSFAFKKQ